MQETRVWSLGWEDPLEKEMATHSSTLAWRIPWREEPGRLQSMGLQRAGYDWATSLSLSDSILKSRDIALPAKVHLVKAMVFPVVMYRCESWTVNKAECQRIDAFELWCWRRLESPVESKEIQPVHPKGNQSWVLIGSTDAEAETPILWPPHVKSWLIGKDPDAGRDLAQEKKWTTEDEIARWHHRLNAQEFGWTPGVGDGQGGLVCCDSWGHKESNTTEWLSWTELSYISIKYQ